MGAATLSLHSTVLWDVVAEHLDEAEFVYSTLARAIDSPRYTLEEVARGPEPRLFAHLDGLVLGGTDVAHQLLIPELEAPKEPRLARSIAASMALLGQGRHDVVNRALESDLPDVARGALQACVLAGTSTLDASLCAELGSPLEPRYRRVLMRLAAGRGLAIDGALEGLQSADTDDALAAAVLARHAPSPRHLAATEALLQHPDARVRDAALVTSLAHGSAFAFSHCLVRASHAEEADALAMLLVALVGTTDHHDALVQHLGRPTHKHAALFALGFTGQRELVPILLGLMASDDARAARLAGEAFADITGLDTSQDAYVQAEPPEEESLPPLEDDDLDADLVPHGDDALPLPSAPDVANWWQENAAGFDARTRLLAGAPWSVERVVERLDHGSMRRRHALALWLTIRSGGRVQVDTRAFTARQRAQLAPARSLSGQAPARGFK